MIGAERASLASLIYWGGGGRGSYQITVRVTQTLSNREFIYHTEVGRGLLENSMNFLTMIIKALFSLAHSN